VSYRKGVLNALLVNIDKSIDLGLGKDDEIEDRLNARAGKCNYQRGTRLLV